MRRLLTILVLAAASPAWADDAKGSAFFEQHIRPLFAERCYKCHSKQAKTLRGGLLLDSRPGWVKGGENGPVIVPGDPERSRLIQAVRYAGELQMPPTGKLSDKEIALLTEWVKMGAPDPRDAVAATPATRTIGIDKGRSYWAFQPLQASALPEVQNKTWPRTAIDRFILAKLEAKGIGPNPVVDRRKLIRQAAYDLTGLPPSPEEVEAFVNDPSPTAYERLIDRLLESPHYGERWARHWLDVARFAESHGYEQDYDRPYAYHYRDFVIKAFNDDLPYDTFVKWQIAGDEFEPENPLALMATGFLAAGTHATQITLNQAEKERYDELDDMARTIGTTMLGVTIGCARCHDHKYDPIPVSDYYRLISTFSTTVRSDFDVNLDPQGYRVAKDRFDKEHAPLVAALKRLEREELPQRFEAWRQSRGKKDKPSLADYLLGRVIGNEGKLGAHRRSFALACYSLTESEWWRLARPVIEHAKKAPKPKVTKALISSEGVPAVRLHTQGLDFYDPVHHLKRGDPKQKGEVAKQGFLQVLTRGPQRQKHWEAASHPTGRTSNRRRALANWLTDVDSGAGALLARVIVNRLWYLHMGRGIVATPSDFGVQGTRPTHPELLDWLAGELIRNDWRLKPIHKLIMTSAVYMQSGDVDDSRNAADRDNTLFWHRPPRRLEAESIRDAMLAVSGTLDRRMFGPGTLDPKHKRRSIYFFVKRSQLVPMMVLFDAPDSLQDIATRPVTTVAPQSLLLMNSPIVRSYATNFARRIKPAADEHWEKAVQSGYVLALSRRPRAEELAESTAFLQQQTQAYQNEGKKDAADLALSDFCQTLFALNEFIYIE